MAEVVDAKPAAPAVSERQRQRNAARGGAAYQRPWRDVPGHGHSIDGEGPSGTGAAEGQLPGTSNVAWLERIRQEVVDDFEAASSGSSFGSALRSEPSNQIPAAAPARCALAASRPLPQGKPSGDESTADGREPQLPSSSHVAWLERIRREVDAALMGEDGSENSEPQESCDALKQGRQPEPHWATASRVAQEPPLPFARSRKLQEALEARKQRAAQAEQRAYEQEQQARKRRYRAAVARNRHKAAAAVAKVEPESRPTSAAPAPSSSRTKQDRNRPAGNGARGNAADCWTVRPRSHRQRSQRQKPRSEEEPISTTPERGRPDWRNPRSKSPSQRAPTARSRSAPPPLRSRSRRRPGVEEVAARAAQPKPAWRAGAPAKGKRDPFEMAGKYQTYAPGATARRTSTTTSSRSCKASRRPVSNRHSRHGSQPTQVPVSTRRRAPPPRLRRPPHPQTQPQPPS
eukprot:COSAG05_NODE_3534_length_2005_cov_1.855719_1_plen_459_part_10